MRDLERRKEKWKEGLEEKIKVQKEAITKWKTVAQ